MHGGKLTDTFQVRTGIRLGCLFSPILFLLVVYLKAISVTVASTSAGLNIQKGKNKILKFNTENTNPITLSGESLEEVESFVHLVSIVDQRGGSDAGIGKARAAFLQLKNVWNSKQLSTNIKVRILNTNVKTVLLYGAET
ncbi:unnamed protein product [Schistosoma curassoni]|uniref:DUF6451 domain-containing protein n=1 Tax=Schistosoma curassoni TaxID=6186 RepID=A0A183L2H5_9TREM|nr:unnamed protein product [Schistosoma curassoni]